MRTKLVKRYYCDYCSRGSLTHKSMQQHEQRCFRNPNRFCEVCGCSYSVPENSKLIRTEGLDLVIKLVNNCPACILAAILQRYPKGYQKDPENYDWIEFDYKKRLEEWNLRDVTKIEY